MTNALTFFLVSSVADSIAADGVSLTAPDPEAAAEDPVAAGACFPPAVVKMAVRLEAGGGG